MSVRTILAGATNQSVTLRIIDSTDGTPETGVTFESVGIDLWYRREGAAAVDITEVTLAALTTAHTDGGFLAIADGWYRLDLPDAACAAGVTGVQIGGTVTGMVVLAPYIELVAYNPYDAVRLGLTALPNAAADAAGGLVISDAGGLDADAQRADVAAILVDTAVIGAAGAGLTALATQASVDTIDNFLDTEIAAILAAVDTEVAAILADTNELQTDWVNGGRLDLILDARASQTSVDTIEAQTDDIGVAGAGLTAVPWNAAWDADVQSEVQDAIEANNLDHLVGTATGIPALVAGTYLDQVVDDGTAAYDRTTDSLQAMRDHATTIKTETASILDDTDDIGVAGAGLTVLATQASVDTIDNFLDTELAAILAAVDTEVAAILSAVNDILADTGTDGVVVAAASKAGYTLSATGSAALTEGYAADGAAATLPELLYLILALLGEFAITTTTLTAKKLDGSTTAATFTLDSATVPTSITRAT